MPSKVSFIAGGGANFIGGSFYVLKFGDTFVGIDYGAKLRCNMEDAEPDFSVVPNLDYLLLSHAHRDHGERIPQAVKRFLKLKSIFATNETKLLSLGPWKQTVRNFTEAKLPAPFTMEEVYAAYRTIQNISMQKPIILPEGITIFPISAGHILGSLSFLIEYQGDHFFITNDICYQDRSFLKGALKFQVENLRLLMRESTCINEVKNREEVKNGLVASTQEALGRGEQVLIASLSIDRAQDVYAILKSASIEPLFIDGSSRAFGIYRQYFKGSILNEARILKDCFERENIRRRGKPAVIIAPSGMLLPDSPSSWWAEKFLGDERKHIFVVCYQEPSTQGFKILNSEAGDFLLFNDELIKRKCGIKYFDLSAHMDKKDGEELEDRMNPDTTIYVHGDDAEIEKFISEHQSDGRRRIKALVGQEVEV